MGDICLNFLTTKLRSYRFSTYPPKSYVTRHWQSNSLLIIHLTSRSSCSTILMFYNTHRSADLSLPEIFNWDQHLIKTSCHEYHRRMIIFLRRNSKELNSIHSSCRRKQLLPLHTFKLDSQLHAIGHAIPIDGFILIFVFLMEDKSWRIVLGCIARVCGWFTSPSTAKIKHPLEPFVSLRQSGDFAQKLCMLLSCSCR